MALTKGRKSRYALKLRRKAGQGRIDPRWAWWFERGIPAAGTRSESQTEQTKGQ